MFSAGATWCEPDKQGRILIPQKLREYAGMAGEKTEVVVAGSFDKIEVWNMDSWTDYNEGDGSMTLDEAGAKLAEMGL